MLPKGMNILVINPQHKKCTGRPPITCPGQCHQHLSHSNMDVGDFKHSQRTNMDRAERPSSLRLFSVISLTSAVCALNYRVKCQGLSAAEHNREDAVTVPDASLPFHQSSMPRWEACDTLSLKRYSCVRGPNRTALSNGLLAVFCVHARSALTWPTVTLSFCFESESMIHQQRLC